MPMETGMEKSWCQYGESRESWGAVELVVVALASRQAGARVGEGGGLLMRSQHLAVLSRSSRTLR